MVLYCEEAMDTVLNECNTEFSIELKKWWQDETPVEYEVIDIEEVIEQPRRRTLIELWGGKEKDPVEEIVSKELQARRKQSEKEVKKMKFSSSNKKNDFAKGYVVTNNLTTQLDAMNLESKLRKKIIRTLTFKALQLMKANYNLFWKKHHDNVKTLGSNCEILQKYYHGTVIT